ncbi:AAC(3)-I family aminoglycoside N-acetyltransferase [Fodinicurvata sediminis]|uniref:AAC(3)-I family aminoglycoside N-acetyltransferase n=1 Tax=Fodinicurvata sediminis TaxID=1121832 RepID=UPI0003B5161D|nr:AAC(3)-I family aminoglycoside N-acetyltransferase [Fodinicurvata sediminis]
MDFSIRELSGEDTHLFRELLSMFGEVFEEVDTYSAAQPGEAYLCDLLKGEQLIALAAVQDDQVVGGLAAYELKKFERERSEIYIYDLAVAAAHRRKGIATALIDCVKGIASRRGAYVVFVQAEPGDAAAIALYTKLGRREDVLHFDIPIE